MTSAHGAHLSDLAGRRMPERVRVALLLAPALVVVGVFFVGGLAQGVLQSLGREPFVGESTWSLDAYRSVLTDPAFRASLAITARVAVLSTLIATVLGVGLALLVRRVGGRAAMTGLFQSTLAIPHLVGALSIGLLLAPSGLLSRAASSVGLVDDVQDVPALTQDAFGWGIIAEYAWKETPFIAVVALAALSRSVVDLEDVARTLGAGPWARLRSVTLPLLAAPVAAASVLVLAFAAASYEVPRLLGRPFPATLPVEAFTRFRDPDLTARPEAMAIATVVAVLTALAAVAYLRLISRLSGRAL
ncbi:MAG: ABC transporter permease subunit [Nocardioides sp.]